MDFGYYPWSDGSLFVGQVIWYEDQIKLIKYIVFSGPKGRCITDIWQTVLIRTCWWATGSSARGTGGPLNGNRREDTETGLKKHRLHRLPQLRAQAVHPCSIRISTPGHTSTKTSWKSKDVLNQIKCLVYRMPTHFKGNYCLISVVGCCGNESHNPSVWHIWHVTQRNNNIWHHAIFVGNPTFTTDYVGSIINLSTLPTGGQKFPPVPKGLAQGMSHLVRRISCLDSWN